MVEAVSSRLREYETKEDEFQDELAPGSKLFHGQYVVEEFLNSGGFGITYLAKDAINRSVVIKECFPESICSRSNSAVGVRSRSQIKAFRAIVDLFIGEARNLARLSHPNIVGVHQVFEDNGTAYMAMDFIEGRDLMAFTENADSFRPSTLEQIVIKLLDAIEFIHGEGVLHRDIAPDNILLAKDNEPVLIDFGAARDTVSKATRLIGSMRAVKDGYSPQEFYIADGEQSPSSDLYSLAATLYHVMAKQLPVNAQTRLSAIAAGEKDPYVSIKERVWGFPEPFLDAIDTALNLFPKTRIQSAAEWRAIITRTNVSNVTRGTISKPMLAVDYGTDVSQDDRDESSEKTVEAVPSVPEVVTEILQPERGSSDLTALRRDICDLKTSPTRSGPARTLYFCAAAAAVAVCVASAAVVLSGRDGDTMSGYPDMQNASSRGQEES